MSDTSQSSVILASSSVYRRELLARLGLPFEWQTPEVDETALPGESARDTAIRLARQKAQAVASQHADALVIGSDQVASWRGQHIGKPGNHARALAQLEQFQGETVRFYSAVCIIDTREGRILEDVAEVTVRFRQLTPAELENYLQREQPYDCAGSAKSESLGIALLEKIESDDPTALVGLPLIRVATMLRTLNYPLLSSAQKRPLA
ncbi:MAG: Maf family nucleotide pyrophosphatase [Burkholderiaceae bacterium]|jgi:septum formation protein